MSEWFSECVPNAVSHGMASQFDVSHGIYVKISWVYIWKMHSVNGLIGTRYVYKRRWNHNMIFNVRLILRYFFNSKSAFVLTYGNKNQMFWIITNDQVPYCDPSV